MTFTVGVAQDLPLPDASLNVVTCTLAMHHVPARQRAAAFRDMYRVTKSGGRLLVADFDATAGRSRCMPAGGGCAAPRLPSARWRNLPVLYDGFEIQLEHQVLSDTLFLFIAMLAITVLLWSPRVSWWKCALAGLLIGLSAIVRSTGLPLIPVFVVYLIIAAFPGQARVAKLAQVAPAGGGIGRVRRRDRRPGAGL